MTTQEQRNREAEDYRQKQRQEYIDPTLWLLVKGVILTFMALVMLAVASSFFKAKAYNRLTGKDMTTWEAFFLNPQIRE